MDEAAEQQDGEDTRRVLDGYVRARRLGGKAVRRSSGLAAVVVAHNGVKNTTTRWLATPPLLAPPLSTRQPAMAPAHAVHANLSPAELSFLRAALVQTPPIRLDHTRGPKDFRPMRAEHDVLPSANGSARIALDDGTEALVGVKAEVDTSQARPTLRPDDTDDTDDTKPRGQNAWIEMSVEIPGFRDDDPLPVFLASMLTESLLASGGLKDRLYINRRFHWKLYIDVSAPTPSRQVAPLTASDTPHLGPSVISFGTSIHGHAPCSSHLQAPRAEVREGRRPAF